MIKKIALFFIGMALFGNAYAGISGSADDRVVIGWDGAQPDYINEVPYWGNIWNTSPYNSIVHIWFNGGSCSGEFISPRHILTNGHCNPNCGTNGNANCRIHTSDGLELSVREVLYGMEFYKPDGSFDEDKWTNNRDKDWAILEIVDDYCRPEYKKIGDYTATMNGVWRAGFGALRVLNQSDIDAIRAAYDAYLRAGGIGGSLSYGNNGKNKYGGMYVDVYDSNFATRYEVFLDEFTRITGRDFLHDYDWDVNTLKLVPNCSLVGAERNGNIAMHNCESWGGDSGSSLKRQGSNHIIALNYAAFMNITTDNDDDGVNSAILPYFYDQNIQSIIEKGKRDCENWNPGVEPRPVPRPVPQPDKKNCDLTCSNNTIAVGGTSGCYNFVANENKCLAATGKHMRSNGTSQDGTFTYTCVDYYNSPDCTGSIGTQPVPLPDPNQADCELRCDNIYIRCNGGDGMMFVKQFDNQCFAATGKHIRELAYPTGTNGIAIGICDDYDKSPACTGSSITQPTPPQGECAPADLPKHATSGRYAICEEFSLGCEEWQRGQQYCEATACEKGYDLIHGICIKSATYTTDV